MGRNPTQISPAPAGPLCVRTNNQRKEPPRKLDEARKSVKTDALDATTLCQRLSRYLDGNTKELAVIRVSSEEEERARHKVR